MGELGPGVSVPSETLGPPPVGRDGDQEVRQPPTALVTHLLVHGQVPAIVQRGVVTGVETDEVVKIFQSWCKGVELVSELK